MSLLIEQWGLIPYRLAQKQQMQLVTKLHDEPKSDDVCLFLEHPPVFTMGRNGTEEHVKVSQTFLRQRGIELIRIKRGGEVTYHGPGQIVCYPIINLRRKGLTVARFVHTLEEIMLAVVRRFGLDAQRDPRNHGIWLGDYKLGSVGIAINHGISYHGMALNVNLDLAPFSWINPCGLLGVAMSSMERELGKPLDIEEVTRSMVKETGQAFAGHVPPESGKSSRRAPKPGWLKQPLPSAPGYEATRRLLRNSRLHTVCREARCPNRFECFSKGTATFLLMGENCTRNCRFCAVSHGKCEPLDTEEPARIAAAVADMGLRYVVLTSVSRDDLADGGAQHFRQTVQMIRERCPDTGVELLIPDLQGNRAALKLLCQQSPTVLNHNVETVARLYPRVRPQALYNRSLELLQRVKALNPGIVTKSGLMLGLGETEEELIGTMADIRDTGCELLTLGQYLQATDKHLAVQRYVPPAEFARIREIGLELGFAGVAAGPHVRSSYQAEELHKKVV